MRTLVMVGVAVLVGCGGEVGPQGEPGPAGPVGPPGFVLAGDDPAGLVWERGGASGAGGEEKSMAGRAGLPSTASRVLINFDSCAGGLQGAADTVVGFGGPVFDASKTQRISTGIDCDFDNNSIPRSWLSRQLWVPLEPNQALVLWFFPFSGSGSTSMRYRLQLLGWVP